MARKGSRYGSEAKGLAERGGGGGGSGRLLPGTLELLVLSVVLGEPLHAYGIAQAIDEASANVLSVPEGSLFPCLERLHREGCVVRESRVVQGRRRVVYSITGTGRMRFERAHKAWLRVASAVDQVVQRYT